MDSDDDQLPNAWEIKWFGNLDETASGDPDGDGLNNQSEAAFGTSPIDDDADGDGANDSEEAAAGTSPFVADSDGDGMVDGYEIDNDLDSFSDDRQLDRDGDGIPNQWEYVKGTAAGDNASKTTDWVVDPVNAAASASDNIVATIGDAVASIPVDTGTVSANYKSIMVKSGTYAENVTIPSNKRVALVGERGGRVVLTGSSASAAVVSFGERSVVDGLVITRPPSVTQSGTTTGAGVNVRGSAAHNIGRIVNCIVYGHTRGIQFDDNPTGSPQVEYCTVWGNTGAGLYAPYRDRIATVKNCVIWNPAAGSSNQFGSSASYVPNLAGNIVYGGQFGGTNVDPLLNPRGELSAGSSAIDAASGATIWADIHGEGRPVGAARDMGADEWADTDADGLSDNWEMRWFGNLAQTISGDPDGDELANSEEDIFGTDPNDFDTDGNGRSDLYDALVQVGLWYYPAAWRADTDGDGLSDQWEVYWNTDPNLADTNGDGVSDFAVWNNIDPLSPDTDGDGISNVDELEAGTNPLLADSDHDGVDDDDDWYPTDPELWEAPALDPMDTTGPVLTIEQPVGTTVNP